MGNLFSIFDPKVLWLNLRINWLSVIILLAWMPGVFWFSKPCRLFITAKLLKSLAREFKLNFSPINTPGHTHWALSLFLIILLNNVGGITPYTFTASSHLTFSVRLALIRWLGYVLFRAVIDCGRILAHLVPVGTPYILIPFIVLIELVRNIIRPLTLSVRLAANLVAGHLLITLISSPATLIPISFLLLLIRRLVILIILESAVAFIQAYVFRILGTLYLREVNSIKFNYLCNINIFQ
jgi:F-type H+-transporting ATPase subunit a